MHEHHILYRTFKLSAALACTAKLQHAISNLHLRLPAEPPFFAVYSRHPLVWPMHTPAPSHSPPDMSRSGRERKPSNREKRTKRNQSQNERLNIGDVIVTRADGWLSSGQIKHAFASFVHHSSATSTCTGRKRLKQEERRTQCVVSVSKYFVKLPPLVFHPCPHPTHHSQRPHGPRLDPAY